MYSNVHSGACAPDSHNANPLATIPDAMFKFILLLMIAGLLAACSSAPVARQPLAIEQAQAADRDARKALADGELQFAQQQFARALALQRSLDDTAAAATSMINLATVTHRLHDDVTALAWLDTVLLEQQDIYPQQAKLTAAFRKAVILTDLARLSEAESALQSAEKLCAGQCAMSAGIGALRARLLLLNGDAEGALILAQQVSKQELSDKAERANAVRIIAAAEEKLVRPAPALQHYREALETDKALGLSARIGEDLNGMARVSAQLGMDREAAEYARRAVLVNESQSAQLP
jgi:tetratricopeptide (TPR) repeat protein